MGARSRKGGREKGKEPVKDGASSSKREGGGRRRVDDAQARGGPAAAPQPDASSAPTVLQREAKRPQPRASRQAPPIGAWLSLLLVPLD